MIAMVLVFCFVSAPQPGDPSAFLGARTCQIWSPPWLDEMRWATTADCRAYGREMLATVRSGMRPECIEVDPD